VPRTPLEQQLHHEIICMCGTCGRRLIAECDCGLAATMRNEVGSLVAAGKTHDEIVQHFIAEYGSQEPLASPLDRGFNRLAWFVPYLVGAGGMLVVGLAAARWSRRRQAGATAEPAAPLDVEIDERLNDELRNLD
jgi:cytochrome c-type biogenesis protein CcmH/NrfF